MKYWKRSSIQYLEETIFRSVVVEKIRFLILIFRNFVCLTSGTIAGSGARDRPATLPTRVLARLLATLPCQTTLPCHVTLPRPRGGPFINKHKPRGRVGCAKANRGLEEGNDPEAETCDATRCYQFLDSLGSQCA